MHTARIEVSRDEAASMWRKYQSHKHNLGPLDDEIRRIYELISKGRMIIRALESIRTAGLGPDKLPLLAIARADQPKVFFRSTMAGGGVMESAKEQFHAVRGASRRFEFASGTWPGVKGGGTFSAIVPHIPPDIRPLRGVQNYHILFEALWSKEPPIDPMLLRRIGKGDMWLVCGAWDLTPVERAVMADRISGTRS